MMPASTLFVEWRPHNRRAVNLALDIGATLCLAPNILRRRFLAPFRYIFLAFWMLIVLVRVRPDLLIVTSPPPFPSIIAYIYSRLFGRAYIVDSHHRAATGLWYQIPFGAWFTRYIMNEALITLVHNDRIKLLLESKGIQTFTLETKIPALDPAKMPPTPTPRTPERTFAVLVPCSFDPDEPIGEVYEAAASMNGVQFFLSGDTGRLDHSLRLRAPEMITFTGFLTQEAYDALLLSVDAVLALTDPLYPVRPRAVTEALAAGKPFIVTRNEATHAHLSNGALLIDNRASDIRTAVAKLQQHYELYAEKSRQLQKFRAAQYDTQLDELLRLLHERSPQASHSAGAMQREI